MLPSRGLSLLRSLGRRWVIPIVVAGFLYVFPRWCNGHNEGSKLLPGFFAPL